MALKNTVQWYEQKKKKNKKYMNEWMNDNNILYIVWISKHSDLCFSALSIILLMFICIENSSL